MGEGIALPVIAGLAVGIGVIILFNAFSIPLPKQASAPNYLVMNAPPSLPEKVWMGLSPNQCAEPWDDEKWSIASDGKYKDRIQAVIDFLQDQGITVYETKRIEGSTFDGNTLTYFTDDTPIERCEACGCRGWDSVFVLVHKSHVSKMQHLGFGVYSGNFAETRTANMQH